MVFGIFEKQPGVVMGGHIPSLHFHPALCLDLVLSENVLRCATIRVTETGLGQ